MGTIDLRFYLAIFRRHIWRFVAVSLGVASVGLALMLILPPSYRATAKILVESAEIPSDLARSTVATSAMEQFQVIWEDVFSRPNVLALADQFNLYDRGLNLSSAAIFDDIFSRTNVDPLHLQGASNSPAATVFQVSFTANQPDVAAEVVNYLVSRILEKDKDLRTARANDTVSFFEREVARLDAELKVVDQTTLRFKNDNVDALPDSLEFRRSQQSSFDQRLLLLTQEEASLRRRLSDLQRFEPTSLGDQSSAEATALMQLRNRLDEQLAVFSESSPTIRSLRQRIEALEAQIRTNLAAAEEGNPAAPRSEIQIDIAAIQDRLAAISQERNAIEGALVELRRSILATPGNETTLNSLLRNAQNLQAQYEFGHRPPGGRVYRTADRATFEGRAALVD